MIDLAKEFRTLRLLSFALIIIGAGLTVGGFGVALMTQDSSKPAPVATLDEQQSEAVEIKEEPSAAAKPLDSEKREKLMVSTHKIGFQTGLMGLLFLALGGGLKWIIKNTIDDGDEEVQMSDELFKAYANQLALAAKLKEKERKRMK